MSIRISQMRYHSISVDQDIYPTSIVEKYLDTVTFKASTKFYNTTLSSDTVFAKADASTSDENFDKLTRESNIRYRSCIVSLIYLLSTRVDFIFEVHKLEKF